MIWAIFCLMMQANRVVLNRLSVGLIDIVVCWVNFLFVDASDLCGVGVFVLAAELVVRPF